MDTKISQARYISRFPHGLLPAVAHRGELDGRRLPPPVMAMTWGVGWLASWLRLGQASVHLSRAYRSGKARQRWREQFRFQVLTRLLQVGAQPTQRSAGINASLALALAGTSSHSRRSFSPAGQTIEVPCSPGCCCYLATTVL
jgi:hypothetical protein